MMTARNNDVELQPSMEILMLRLLNGRILEEALDYLHEATL